MQPGEWSRGISDIEHVATKGMELWEKRHRRQSREGSGEEAGTRPSFKWAGAHESTWAASEFQPPVDDYPNSWR